jgi:MoxR-like ATPase
MTEPPRFHLLRRVDNPNDHNPQPHREALAERHLPRPLRDFTAAAPHFRPDDNLITAVNMSLAVGAPLLLTGEPGTGKTQVAYHLSWFFGIPLFEYMVRSTSTAEDLKYDFDAVAYLRAAQQPQRLGRSPRRADFLTPRPLWLAFECASDSVLLIDEIDKAPRDFPNDLLQELDKHEFVHPFNPAFKIRARRDRPPIVIITSNAERRLPDPFLRRCIWYHIKLTEDLLRDAVDSRAGDFPHLQAETVTVALQRFWELREVETLRKVPSTAEVLAWLTLLSAQRVSRRQLAEAPLRELPAINALIKDKDDLQDL